MRHLAATLIVLAAAALPAQAQTLGVGDMAPPLEIAHWIKGTAIDPATAKKITVVEFWATSCPPCVQSIPHLSELQQRYRDKNVVILAITDEDKTTIQGFTRRMGAKMDYTVACDLMGKTTAKYMMASGQMGIPTAFVVNPEGRVLWIGSPFEIDSVLADVVAGKLDVEQAKQLAAKQKAQADADMKFLTRQQLDLMVALQEADWPKCLKMAREIADPANPISNGLRIQVLNAVCWQMLTDERSDKKFFKESLDLAKVAYDLCGCEDPSVIDTYARALYDNGRFKDAVEYQKKAVTLADGQMKDELQASLERYLQAAQSGG